MQRRVGAFFLFAVLAAPMPLAAADLPAIKTTRSNAVPACVTPGRLLAFLESRNPQLDPRFHAIAADYMRLGETLGVRWDYAFYQMLLETGSLSFRDGNRSGDVKPAQNNFAGLGATGRGAHGESFKDITTGVRAHLEHLLLYAGERVDNPVAERTRKVQEWGVLTDWHKGFARPVTFGDLAAKWAPGTRSYRRMIEGIAERFEEFCARPDPRPELVQEARKDKRASEAKAAEAKLERSAGTELAQRAIDSGKTQSDEKRSALGLQPAASTAATSASVPFRLLNQPEAGKEGPPAAGAAADDGGGGKLDRSDRAIVAAGVAKLPGQGAKEGAKADKGNGADKSLQTASTAAAAKALAAPAPTAAQKCRVWTASYGGQKAMIIKSLVDKVVNYTVLDVNEGAEAREAEAFISAYAKNGAIAGQFGSQAQALEKAFELCPEG
jgi:Mannosyl-glycoprotein endo-beta-N-acetylglucosaminidase